MIAHSDRANVLRCLAVYAARNQLLLPSAARELSRERCPMLHGSRVPACNWRCPLTEQERDPVRHLDGGTVDHDATPRWCKDCRLWEVALKLQETT